MARRDAVRLGELPCCEIRAADVPHLARTDNVVEGAQRLVEGGHRVEAVNLVEIDPVGPEALQAALDGAHDVSAGEALLVRTRADLAAHLRGEHDVFAARAEGLAEDLLGLALGVDVSGVEEIDAALERD